MKRVATFDVNANTPGANAARELVYAYFATMSALVVLLAVSPGI